MKILVISLLRLGDLILHAELIPALKKQYPQAEIQFLINSQFLFAKDLFPAVGKWHCLDRNKIQHILVEQSQSPRAAFEIFESTLKDINSEKIDLVFNLTHNNLSVRVMDLLEAKEKRGACYQNGKKRPFSNLWLSYLNDHFSEIKGSRFHYVEVLHRAMGLEILSIPSQLKKADGPVFLQVLTADLKKNWAMQNFVELKKKILEKFPQEKVYAICSPSEKAELLKYFREEEILSPSLLEAKDLLRQAKLLITGDTSIQHLAASVRTPSLAIHLGSADPIKTSAWLLESQVLQGHAVCSPCKASLKCHQASHLCGQNLTVSAVAEAVLDFLNGRSVPQISKNGEHHFFHSAVSSNELVQNRLEQLSWGFYLNGQLPQDIFILPEMGRVEAELAVRYQALDQELNKMNGKIEKISKAIFASAENGNVGILAHEIKRDIQALAAQYPEVSDSFLKIIQSYQFIDQSFFQFLKVLRAGFKQSRVLNDIRQSLILIELRKLALTDKLKRDTEVPFE